MRPQTCQSGIASIPQSEARPRRPRLAGVLRAAAAGIGLGAWSATDAYGEARFWDDGGGVNDSWRRADNWNPDGVPTATTDVTLGIFVETNRIEAEGSATLVSFPQPGYQFHDPALKANSLTISTAHPVEVDGRLDIDGWFGGSFYTSLTLSSGSLVRQDVAGVEGDQSLNLNVRLASDGVWDVAGSGVLSAAGISETGGARAFTKTGAGTLAAQVFVSGATTISQGTFRGNFLGTGVATIARGAVFQVTNNRTDSPVVVNGSGSGSASMVKVGTGSGTITSPLTIVDNPLFSADAGGTLVLSGGITSVNNSGFALFGAGELRLSGPGTGSILADLRGGQLTIAHDNALGTGSIFAQNALGGVSVVAFADGVTFANPITLLQGTLRGLGNSTVTSNVSLSNLFGGNHTLDVAGAAHTLTFTGSFNDFGGGESLTKTGAGTVTLGGASTYIGGTNVNAGTLQVKRMHENNPVTITGGKLKVLDSSPTLPAHPAGNNASVSRPSSLAVANNGAAPGTRTYNGQLDLGNNDLVLDYSGASPLADIEDMVRAGYNGGDWLGNGITSSTANVDRNFAIGVADNSRLTIKYGATRPFSGQTVDDTTILVKFTHRIDLDLDGVITTNDATIFNSNYAEGAPAYWSIGDLDYDRVFTTNDATLFNSFYSEALASVPEPASLGVLALGGLGLLGRWRRRRRR